MTTEVRGAREHVGKQVIGLRELEPHRVGVDLLDLALLTVDRHGRGGRGYQVLVPVDVLEPEDEIIRGERPAVAPLHPAAQVQDECPSPILHLITAGDVGRDLVARVVPEQQVVGPGAAPIAVPEVGRPREAPAPRSSVLADFVQWLDHQRILPDPLRHGGQLAGLDLLGELRRLLERLGRLRRVGHDLRAFQLPDQGALAGALRKGRHGDDRTERPDRERDREAGSERAFPRRAPELGHEGSPFTRERLS